MALWNILGQDHLIAALDQALSQGRLAHAYLLVGPPQTGKTTLALRLAQAVNCPEQDRPCGQCRQCQRIQRQLHPDVQVIAPGQDERTGRPRTEISIDQVRTLERDAALKPFEGEYRVFIIEGAERMSPDAANALLKTLEEPPEHVLLLLTSAKEEGLLPTIRSRCHRLEVRPLAEDMLVRELTTEHGVAQEDARLLARISGGRLGWAMAAATQPRLLEERQQRSQALLEVVDGGLERRFQFAQELAQQFGRDRSAVREVLGFWLLWWRDLLMLKQQAAEMVVNLDWLPVLEERAPGLQASQIIAVIRQVEATLERLEQNANPRLALEVLMLSLPRRPSTTAGEFRNSFEKRSGKPPTVTPPRE